MLAVWKMWTARKSSNMLFTAGSWVVSCSGGVLLKHLTASM